MTPQMMFTQEELDNAYREGVRFATHREEKRISEFEKQLRDRQKPVVCIESEESGFLVDEITGKVTREGFLLKSTIRSLRAKGIEVREWTEPVKAPAPVEPEPEWVYSVVSSGGDFGFHIIIEDDVCSDFDHTIEDAIKRIPKAQKVCKVRDWGVFGKMECLFGVRKLTAEDCPPIESKQNYFGAFYKGKFISGSQTWPAEFCVWWVIDQLAVPVTVPEKCCVNCRMADRCKEKGNLRLTERTRTLDDLVGGVGVKYAKK